MGDMSGMATPPFSSAMSPERGTYRKPDTP